MQSESPSDGFVITLMKDRYLNIFLLDPSYLSHYMFCFFCLALKLFYCVVECRVIVVSVD